jgi:hypothetical protein
MGSSASRRNHCGYREPVELAAQAMNDSSRPGENVLDLFGGSGTTLIAAIHYPGDKPRIRTVSASLNRASILRRLSMQRAESYGRGIPMDTTSSVRSRHCSWNSATSVAIDAPDGAEPGKPA